MNSVFSEQILEDKLSKLNSTQQCIETLSHWCIFHRGKAEQVAATWDKQFQSSEMVLKVPFLYLANDILQNSKRNGNEFVTEFWKVLPSALKEVVKTGDDRGKKTVSRLVEIWEQRKVFGSRAQSLKDVMLGEELPPPLELGKKRSRSVKIVKRDSKSIRTKLSIGGTVEKIVSAFHLVLSERTNEDGGINKCKSALQRVKRMEKEVKVALTKAKDPSRKTLAKELEEQENLLKQCIDKLKVVEANRVALVSQLRDALNGQESELENLGTQIQVASAQVDESSSVRKCLLDDDRVFESKPSTTSMDSNVKSMKKSAAAIAAEVADKLAASSSSQYIMSAVLSTFAAEEAKSVGLMKPSTPSTSSMPNSEGRLPVSDPNAFMPPQNNISQNNPYQTSVMPQPSIHVQISSSQVYQIPNPPLQYMQPSGGMMSSYDYASLPHFAPGPPTPGPPHPTPGPPHPTSGPPQYMVSPMVPLAQQPAQMTMTQQQTLVPPSFRPLAPAQAPGMVYYTQPYQSQ